MNTRQLGTSNLHITPIGFGAWAIGGSGWEFAWGAQDDHDSIAAIDLYQIHWPDPDEDIEEGWATMAKLKEEGKVRNIGVSNFNVVQMRRAQAIAPITSLQPRYSLLHREIEAEILPFVARENIGVVAYSPMASGLLTGAMTRERIAGLPTDDWRKEHTDFREPQLSRNLELVKLLRAIGERHGRSPGEVAVAWVLRNPVVTGAIVGAPRPGQAQGISGAAAFRLNPGELAEIWASFTRKAA